MAYAHFGDVVTFDTTYLTNMYVMKFAPFVGVNHHGQSVLLGCALLTDETKESFLWVFKTWLTAMEGRPPKAIITDQDPAIKEVFPDICHRFCLWHILKKVPEKLGSVCKANPRFMYKFDKCIYDLLTIDEFERRWRILIETFGLKHHDWVQAMYECRRQWIPVFLKDTFFAGMSTSQRSESMNSFFNDYVNQKTCLKEFIDQYDLALKKRYNDEEKADFITRKNSPLLKTPSLYEAQMASIYTSTIFKKFQGEVLRMTSCFVGSIQLEGEKKTHVVKELLVKPNGKNETKDYIVVWNASKTLVSCICRLFEFQGFLCRHVMVVLLMKGVYEIPPHYILKRWSRDAKRMDVFDEESNEENELRQEYRTKCFNDLCVDFLKAAEEGSLSKNRYKAAKILLKEALEKLSYIDDVTAGLSHQNVQDGCQADVMVPNIVIGDPRVSRSKGWPRERIKSGVELGKSKGKQRTCSRCK